MALEPKAIEFTPLARQQLHLIIDHILKEFGTKSVERFSIALEKKLQLISEGKIAHRHFSWSKQIRYFIVNKKNVILYKELKNSIQILGIYSVRQDLNHLKEK